jgi:hypothetical protein
MFDFLLSIKFLRRLGLGRPFRLALAVIFVVLLIVVSIYTTNLFLSLHERTGAQHVDTHSAH